MEPASARRLWQAAECIHAVTYFHPTSIATITDAGAKGFWMAYFAARMAPLGPIGPSAAIAVCCNFSPARVHRSLPDAWSFVSPADALDARSAGAAAALRECGVDDAGATAAAAALEPLVLALDPSGRPLGGANLDVTLGFDTGTDPIARLWQLCTTLREHRGDGHVALIVGADLDGCEVDVLATAVSGMDPAILRDTRAWTADEWAAGIGRLAERGLVGDDGSRSDAGVALYSDIERRTDALAARTYGDADLESIRSALRPLSRAVIAARVLPFPNPMGLPGD